MLTRSIAALLLAACTLFAAGPSDQEKAIAARMKLRQLPDDERARVTRELALEIRKLPPSSGRLELASGLGNMATEGDFGRDTLQEVTTTLALALRDTPPEADDLYRQLAQLVRYEHMQVAIEIPQLKTAMDQLDAYDRDRAQANFTLPGLTGRRWTLRELKGKVVLVNFWATWCPPCRKEMPDLEVLYRKYQSQGLVVLALTDDEEPKVRAFIAEKKYTFPVLLDAGGALAKQMHAEGIPKSFLYNRKGELAAQAIDMRTAAQFQALLRQAGIE